MVNNRWVQYALVHTSQRDNKLSGPVLLCLQEGRTMPVPLAGCLATRRSTIFDGYDFEEFPFDDERRIN